METIYNIYDVEPIYQKIKRIVDILGYDLTVDILLGEDKQTIKLVISGGSVEERVTLSRLLFMGEKFVKDFTSEPLVITAWGISTHYRLSQLEEYETKEAFELLASERFGA